MQYRIDLVNVPPLWAGHNCKSCGWGCLTTRRLWWSLCRSIYNFAKSAYPHLDGAILGTHGGLGLGDTNANATVPDGWAGGHVVGRNWDHVVGREQLANGRSWRVTQHTAQSHRSDGVCMVGPTGFYGMGAGAEGD